MAASTVEGRGRLPFSGLLGAFTISMLGTSMSGIAIPWLVLTTTGSAGLTASSRSRRWRRTC
jgi:hypothetical protein